MADTTTVGTEGCFNADLSLPTVVQVGTWGWWDTLEAAVPGGVAVFTAQYLILGLLRERE